MCGGFPLLTVLSIMCLFVFFNQNIGYYFIYIAIDLKFDILHQNKSRFLCISTCTVFVLSVQNLMGIISFSYCF